MVGYVSLLYIIFMSYYCMLYILLLQISRATQFNVFNKYCIYILLHFKRTITI